jgi:cytosine/adenosine deaminase-related metal-dependent hydrolase
MWRRPVTFENARVISTEGEASSVRFSTAILELDTRPRRRDVVIDLDGAIVLPGLVNAHDHLELNHYGRLKFRDRYTNVSGWIDDMRPRLMSDEGIAAGRRHSLSDRLFIGILKNLLSGVTTVAHHNPLYRELRRALPIRVVRNYGWAHSLAMQDAPAGARGEVGGDIVVRFRATPRDRPFFVHLGEGIDEMARKELPTLERLGCVAPNVVVIHGVAIQPSEWTRAAAKGASLVWCPASNIFLFDRTAPVRRLLEQSRAAASRIALGTDSRLSGASDLLEELRCAAARDVKTIDLLRMVTSGAADLLRQPLAGRIRVGAPADLFVIPATSAGADRCLLQTTRRSAHGVFVAGRPLVADAGLERAFAARGVSARRVLLDGGVKLADLDLVRRISRCAIREPGMEAA